jgi:hypothetical protein
LVWFARECGVALVAQAFLPVRDFESGKQEMIDADVEIEFAIEVLCYTVHRQECLCH